MPHVSVKLRPGVDQTETAALNEAGITTSNLVRFVPDRTMGAIIQKLGGWTKYFANTMAAIPRALWAWQDTANNKHLAIGTQDQTATYEAQLSVITDGNQTDITPRSIMDNVTPSANSTAGSSIIRIDDSTTQNITQYDTVYIPAHISIGGVILFGLYQCDPDGYLSATAYTVQATDVLGNAKAATATSTTTAVASFATTNGSSTVTVTLADHGYAVGDLYPVLISTTVGGVTFLGHYTVNTVPSTSTFTITGTQEATATTSGSINNGKARFIYGFGVGSIPAGTGWGVGTWGSGGWGTGAAIAPTTGTPVQAKDWTIDNWGEILVACPETSEIELTTTALTGNGATAVLSHTGLPYTIPVGTQIVVANVTPTTVNGTQVVTAATSTSVSFASAETGPMTVAGTITMQNPQYQPVYYWDPEAGSPKAQVLPNAPPVSDGVFVAMPQRQLVCWGSTFTGIQDPLMIRWSDVNNLNSWIGTPINFAGYYRIPRGSRIVACMQGPQQGLIWTDVGVWTMQFVGAPLVYSFQQIGFNCGLIGRKAAGVLNGTVYWMGPNQFYQMADNGAEPLRCPVWDVVFQNIDLTYPNRIRCAVNSLFGEIAWYYASDSGSGEIDSYVKYNAYVGEWDYGSLGRSAWVDQSVLGEPIGADPSSLYLYQHETSTDADGSALLASFRSGYAAIADGDQKMFVDQVYPDMKWGYNGAAANATVNLTFYVTDYPGDTPTAFGPYALTQSSQYVTPRFRGRLVAIQLDSSDVGSFWRIGNIRYRAKPDGVF